MKKWMNLGLVVAALVIAGLPALAQDTTSGTLSVSATVDSSISLTFEQDAGGVAMAGAGSSAATVGFGTVSAYENVAANVTRSVNGVTNYTLSTPFGVKVVKANSASADYTLTAALGSAPSTESWMIGSTSLSTTSATVASAQSYGSAISHSLKLVVPHSLSAGAISNTINFTATAN